MRLVPLLVGLLITSPVQGDGSRSTHHRLLRPGTKVSAIVSVPNVAVKPMAEPYYGSWTFNGDGSVKLDNGARINSCMVMRGPNPTGHAVWWHKGEISFAHRRPDGCPLHPLQSPI